MNDVQTRYREASVDGHTVFYRDHRRARAAAEDDSGVYAVTAID